MARCLDRVDVVNRLAPVSSSPPRVEYSRIRNIGTVIDVTEPELKDESAVEEALYVWKDSAAEFADCLIGAHHRRLGCRATATFDARAVNLPGVVTA